MPSAKRAELTREQTYVAGLYRRLDQLREHTRRQLVATRRRGASGTPQARSERDAFATLYEDRLAQLDAVEGGLCFGRLDLETGQRHYVGRLGLSDEQHESVLVDWRAPAAQAFYRATPAAPHGVVRRRHLRTRAREVVDLDDDVFDLDRLTDDDRATLGGEAALLASLDEGRTGRMRDIVATIQAEQDRIIRADESGVLVVQGGPGTGKTVVALHRAAYLLYTFRDRLARSGVLVVGPSPVFLHYIEQVLPSLGETGVLLATPETLLPGIEVTGREPEEVAALKGDGRMAAVIAAAVAARQRVPDEPLVVPFDEHELLIDDRLAAAARSRARRSRRPHNRGRLTFARLLLQDLVVQAATAAGDPRLMKQRWLVRALMRTDEFRAAVDTLWPRIRPEQLIDELLSSPDSLAAAAPGLSAEERRLLQRPPGAPWTAADVPLLDEATALLGDPDEAVRQAQERRRRREQERYAAEVLDLTGQSGQVDAGELAERFDSDGPGRTVAERAAGDPTWQFGHVIVDEAQELSPMAWRMMVRRCPSRSMTIVGDTAQTSAAWGARSWQEVLGPFVGDRWQRAELTVNYRTPAEIMAVAAEVLRQVDRDATAPASVRDGAAPPWAQRAEPDRLAPVVAELAAGELAELAEGTVAVLTAPGLHPELADAVRSRLPDDTGDGVHALDARVAVLPTAAAKGLEFDVVLVVEPARILGESPQGARDLYVALTRATRRLGVVHTGELPAMLAGLAERPVAPHR